VTFELKPEGRRELCRFLEEEQFKAGGTAHVKVISSRPGTWLSVSHHI
jgi:hypothetical protein